MNPQFVQAEPGHICEVVLRSKAGHNYVIECGAKAVSVNRAALQGEPRYFCEAHEWKYTHLFGLPDKQP